jgi:hypothetical protein
MTPFSTVKAPSVCWILSYSLCGGLPLCALIPWVGRLEVVVARGEILDQLAEILAGSRAFAVAVELDKTLGLQMMN